MSFGKWRVTWNTETIKVADGFSQAPSSGSANFGGLNEMQGPPEYLQAWMCDD